MAPFVPPNTILSGFKERIESLLVQGKRIHLYTFAYETNTNDCCILCHVLHLGDKLYVGTATGNLHVYVLHNGESSAFAVNSSVYTFFVFLCMCICILTIVHRLVLHCSFAHLRIVP